MKSLEKYCLKIILVLFLIISYSITAQTKKLLILGDSISAGFGIKESQNWTTLLKSSFSKEGKSLKIINSSISGDTTSGGLSRISRDLNSYEKKVELDKYYYDNKNILLDLRIILKTFRVILFPKHIKH